MRARRIYGRGDGIEAVATSTVDTVLPTAGVARGNKAVGAVGPIDVADNLRRYVAKDMKHRFDKLYDRRFNATDVSQSTLFSYDG